MIRKIFNDGRRAALKSSLHSILMRHPTLEKRCVARAQEMGIQTILDVGANHGQFARRIRSLGWDREILSFEPLLEPYTTLKRLATKDELHQAFPFALGDVGAEATMNVASNHGASSSLLELSPIMTESFAIETTSQETIEVRRLDEVAKGLQIDAEHCLLKIDTQGFEKQVLVGAGDILHKIPILFLEVSMRQTYKDEPLLQNMLNFLDGHGFEMRDVQSSVFGTPFHPFQCDILCLRKGVD